MVLDCYNIDIAGTVSAVCSCFLDFRRDAEPCFSVDSYIDAMLSK